MAARSRRRAIFTSKLDDDHDKYGRGFTVFESLSPAPAQFAAEAGLTAYTMAAAAGVVDAYSDIIGEKWKPYGAAGRRPATVGQPAKPRSPPSGEAVRAESQNRVLPPHSSSLMAWRAAARHRSSRLGAVLRNWETATEAQASRHRQKKRPRTAHGQHKKIFGTGCDSAIPAIRPWTNKPFLTVHHNYCSLKIFLRRTSYKYELILGCIVVQSRNLVIWFPKYS
jgi:hypothetical protein